MCFSALYCHSLRGFGCSRFVLVVSVPRKREIVDLSTSSIGLQASWPPQCEVPIVLVISPLSALIDTLEDTVSLAGHEILFTSPEVLETGCARSETDGQTPAAASYYRHVTQKFHGNRIFISRMLNRNPKWLSAEVFSSAQKQPKQNASSQNREENGSTTLRNTREKPLLAGYMKPIASI